VARVRDLPNAVVASELTSQLLNYQYDPTEPEKTEDEFEATFIGRDIPAFGQGMRSILLFARESIPTCATCQENIRVTAIVKSARKAF
jgi:hypothetical protein